MSAAPQMLKARAGALAVWTGTEAVIWGGNSRDGTLRNGARYDPVRDTWVEMSGADNEEIVDRACAAAIWLGELAGGGRLLIWGGSNVEGDVGLQRQVLLYDPVHDAWDLRGPRGAPPGKEQSGVVWTGKRVIVWGGAGQEVFTLPGTGGLYDPVAGQWSAITSVDAPSSRYAHATVWTGDRMLVWGGRGARDASYTGGAYDPENDRWFPISQDSNAAVDGDMYAAWTGSELLAWNGRGSRYDPRTDTWRPMSDDGGPSFRSAAASVWTGRSLIIWGGGDITATTDGARYEAAQDRWVPLPTEGAPSARAWAASVWTGEGMVVWGGGSRDGRDPLDGAVYYPPTTP